MIDRQYALRVSAHTGSEVSAQVATSWEGSQLGRSTERVWKVLQASGST